MKIINNKTVCFAGWFLILTSTQAASAACYDDSGASTPTSDFIVHNNGTVTHKTTGLMWMRCARGQDWDGSICTGTAATYTWQGALQNANEANNSPSFAGYTDWRLPNIKELASIAENRCSSPSINTTIFPNTPVNGFWSSSPSPDINSAWFLAFVSYPRASYGLASGTRPIRLVRDAVAPQ